MLGNSTCSMMSDRSGYNDNSVNQSNRGLVNLTGSVTGNGNGNIINFFNHTGPPYDKPWKDFGINPSTPSSPTTTTVRVTFHRTEIELTGHVNFIPEVNYGSSSSLSKACNKRAVLCGVTYGKRKFRLKGTINDVINMKDLLVNKFQFPIECIRVLTEEEKDPNLIPTRRNILESLKWLVKDCKSGDSLVFYFSGHGLQQTETNEEDEIDGLDEALCPVDFMKEGIITDNEINSIIVRPLVNGVTLHAIIDASHSATTLDLIHVYKKANGSWKWMDNRPPSKEPINKNTSGGLAICLSACECDQMATDTAAFGGKENGVMTYLLTKTIREHRGLTYIGLLEKMHEEIGKIHQSKHNNGFLKRIFHRKVEQDPILSSSEKIDVFRRIFTF